ncbi:hypothetical protein AVEN_161166-1 [Araneus ventricosus]|uniref:C2H2-type domain-containing protein n=1 Tax=Araneus ventricosus TaxID=182803 RepID=A0A4Y2SCW1_ARAVE|nr:hypothetical protein AVEN_161166-1 [Araneus ventricosus]
MNTLSSEMQNSWGPTLSFHRQDDESANPSSSNYLTSPLSAACANLQHLMHISHQSSSTERENKSSIEMMLQMQRTVESSEIENIGDQIVFAGSSASASCMSQSVSGSIIDHNVRGTRNKASHSSADLSSTRGNSSTGNFFSEDLESVNEASQQDAHSSEKQTRLYGMENYPTLSAFPVKRSLSPTSKLVFECKKCTRKFTKDFLLNAHMQDHDEQNPHKCNQCPMAFHGKGRLRMHYEVHTEEKPFK